MSDNVPRRVDGEETPSSRTGYRSSRRGSKSQKSAKRAERSDRFFSTGSRFVAVLRTVGYVLALILGGMLVAVVAFLLIANGINGVARWSAKRHAAVPSQTTSAADLKAKENLLLIATENGKAAGFLAMRIDGQGKQVFGIAIPDGAFIEVPGQGFERVAESYAAGPDVSLAAVSNYLSVPFRAYATVPVPVYQDMMKNQSVASLGTSIGETNLSAEDRSLLVATLASIPVKNTAFVPLPVKPIKLGDETYFEPGRTDVADLLKAWWGIDATATASVTRVILYNGAGVPGIAGQAAQQLIKAGFRVIDTKNADKFTYKTTQVVVQKGPIERGNDVVNTLGVGVVKQKRTDENVVDIVVIIGNDYKAPK